MSDTVKGLLVFVEGTDDQRFFERVVQPKLEVVHGWVSVQLYAQTSPKSVNGFIRNTPRLGADYIFVGDINGNPCVEAKKYKLQESCNCLEKDKVIVVEQEIESWYLAGLREEHARKFLGTTLPADTSVIDKAQFDRLMAKRFSSRIDFITEILKVFSVEAAQEANRSFRYLWEKFIETSG